ncbi:hypothetical protein ENHYDAX1_280005 [Enhydrobacter sp. AX1]|nr:hypothetical protein ENHYDAX1_280005 [Enhydrobacter sp. AX1]
MHNLERISPGPAFEYRLEVLKPLLENQQRETRLEFPYFQESTHWLQSNSVYRSSRR